MSALIETLEATPIVPLVGTDDAGEAVRITEALIAGGLNVIEVVLRSNNAMAGLEAIAKEFPDTHVGAGTVLSADQCRGAIDAGATFIVSPGLDPASAEVCEERGAPYLPGVVTATELQAAWNMGLRLVKFFPASLSGGPKKLKALSSVFRDVRFMPTGGVGPANLKDYLDVPSVLACGGSWLTPKDAVAGGDYATITRLAEEARDLAK